MRKKLRSGVGATATVLKKFFRSKKVIGDRYSKIAPQECLNDLVVVRKDTKPIKSKQTTVIFFCHGNFPNDYICISERYCKVLKERKEADLFDNYIPPPPQE